MYVCVFSWLITEVTRVVTRVRKEAHIYCSTILLAKRGSCYLDSCNSLLLSGENLRSDIKADFCKVWDSICVLRNSRHVLG